MWCDYARRFAQNEFEHGSVERGRSVFEGLMASYPKRLDLWNVYFDKEVKAGDLRAARNLLERLVSEQPCERGHPVQVPTVERLCTKSRLVMVRYWV